MRIEGKEATTVDAACVVVAVDGSASCLPTVDWAADEASRRGVGLILLRAGVREHYEAGTAYDGDLASERKAVQVLLSAAAERVRTRFPQLPLDTEASDAQPVAALLALEPFTPLLVLGACGRGGSQALLLGSVSLRIAARAAFPVAVVRGTVPDYETGHRPRVVIGIGPHKSPALTDFAVREAFLRQADLVLVHAWRSATDASRAFALMDTTAEHVHRLLATAPRWVQQGAGVHVERKSTPGNPVEVLLREARGADLLVVGARRRHRHFGLQLGPVNNAMLHHAPCPVAVVPAGSAPGSAESGSAHQAASGQSRSR